MWQVASNRSGPPVRDLVLIEPQAPPVWITAVLGLTLVAADRRSGAAGSKLPKASRSDASAALMPLWSDRVGSVKGGRSAGVRARLDRRHRVGCAFVCGVVQLVEVVLCWPPDRRARRVAPERAAAGRRAALDGREETRNDWTLVVLSDSD